MNIVRNPSIVLVAALMLASTGLRASEPGGNRHSGFRLSADAFVPNVGQVVSLTGEKVHYCAAIEGGRAFFLDNRVAFVFDGYKTDPITGEEELAYAYRTDLVFPGAAPKPAIDAGDRLPYFQNYYTAAVKAENLSSFASLAYRNLWPGVDLIFRLHEGALKYDFVLAPGVSHNVVKIQYSDYQSLNINGEGQIVLTYPGGELREMAPVSFALSDRNGQKSNTAVESRYRMSRSGEIVFDVKGRKKSDVLVIDPLVRARATFYGGTSNDQLVSVAIDDEYSVIAAGFTRSTNNYLTQNGYQVVQKGLSDVMLVKFDANGARRWATFVGGPGDDAAYGLTVDPAGNAYLVGSTRGNGYPEFNPSQTTGLGNEDVVLSSFRSNGTIRFSTRFGGSNSDRGLGVAFDAENNRVVVAGNTSSSDLFGADNVYGGNRDGFVAAFTHDGGFLWSKYFGSDRDDRANAVAVDASGKVYLVGGTASNALPGAAGNYQPQNAGNNDAYIAALSDDGQILRSTFFGGADLDEALSISLDASRIAVVGRTRSENLPLSADARQPFNNGGGDAFFALFNYELTGVPYSTYLGGTGSDELTAVRLTGNRAYLAGRTLSTDFPVLVNNVTPQNQSENAGLEDAVLAEFSLTGPSPAYINGFYYGGARNDAALGLAAVPAIVAVVGATRSINLPLNFAQAPFNSFKGVEDGFLTVYEADVCPAPAAISLGEYQTLCDTIRLRFFGGTAPYTVQFLTPNGILTTVTTDANGRVRFAHLGGGFYDLVSILDNVLCVGDPNAGTGGFDFNAGSLLAVSLAETGEPLCAGDPTGRIEVSVSGGTPPYVFEWTGPDGFAAFNEDISGLLAGSYELTVTDAVGCTARLSAVTINEPAPLAVEPINNIGQLTCLQPTGLLDVTVSGGVAPYTVTWQGPGGFEATGSQVSVSDGGAYTVFVSDANGCGTSASTLVSANFGNLTIDAQTTPTSCGPATDGTITVFPTGGTPPYNVSVVNNVNGQPFPPSQNFVYPNLPAAVYRITVTDVAGCQRNLLREVLVGEGTLQISMSGEAVACFGDLTGVVRATVVGGTPPYQYTWTIQNGEVVAAGVGVAFSQLINRPAGEYTVVVTDAVGCQKTGFFTITQPTAPLSVNVGAQTNVLCHGQSTGALSVFVSGGASEINFTVSWTGPNGFVSSAPSISGVQAGAYSAVVTDANGCTAATTVNITQPAAPLTINLGQIVPSICGGAGGAVLINPTGGTPPYAYQWSTGATTQNLSNAAAGQYSVTVTDANDCVAGASYVVNQLGTTLFASFNPPVDATCSYLNNGSLSVVAAGGQPPYQYTWRRNGTVIPLLGPSLINIPGGNYSVTVSDAYGCTFEIPFIPVRQRSQIDVNEVNIAPPSCSGGGNAQIELNGISGGNYPGESVGYNVRIAFGDTVIAFDNVGDSFIFNSVIADVPITPGVYILTIITANPDGCLRTWTLQIPDAETFTATVSVTDATGCGPDNYGEIVVAPSGLPDFSVRAYSLPDNLVSYDITRTVSEGESANFTQVPPGFIAYRADNAEGCFVLDTVFVGASDIAFADSAAAGSCASLADGTITVTGEVAASYTLYRANGTVVSASDMVLIHTFSGLAEGTYYVIARSGDCFGTKIVEVDFPEFEWQTRLAQPASCNFSSDGRILALATGYNDIRYSLRDSNNVVIFPPQIGGVFPGLRTGEYTVTAFRLSQPLCFIEFTDTVEYETELNIESVEAQGQACSGAGVGSITVDATASNPELTIYYTLFQNNAVVAGPQTQSWFIPLFPGAYTVRVGLDTINNCFDEREVIIEAFTTLELTLSPDVLTAKSCNAPYNPDPVEATLTINPSSTPNINYDLYNENGWVMNLGTNLGLNYTFSDQTVTGYNNIEPGEYRIRATVADGMNAGCYAEAKWEIQQLVREPVEITGYNVTPGLACGYDNANGDASGAISVTATGVSNEPSAQIWYRLESTNGFVVRRWQTEVDFLNLLPANYLVRAAFFTGDPNNPENCGGDVAGCVDSSEIIRVGIRSPKVLAPLNNGYSVIPTTGVAPYPDITTPNWGSNRTRIYWRSDGGYEGGFAGAGGTPTPAGASNTYRIAYRVVGSGNWQTVVVANANLTNTVSDGVVLWFDLTGLQPQTVYEYRIQTRACGSSDFEPVSGCGPQTGSTDVGGVFSDWATSSTYRFNTLISVSCDTPAYVMGHPSIINGTNVVADVSWPVDQPNASCFVLELAYAGSPATLRRVAVPSIGSGVQTYRFENLQDGTDYDVRVYTICGGPCPSTTTAPPAGTPRKIGTFTTPFLRLGKSSLGGFTVYPNPNKGEFSLSFQSQGEGTGTLSLTDVTGRTVFVRAQSVERGLNVLNVSEALSAGLYLVRFQYGDAAYTAKINVE